MSRDTKGNIGWSILAIVFGVITLVPMIGREVYQSKKGGFSLEWEDIFRYGIYILAGSIWHWFIIEILELPSWLII